jgi:predicted ArsR family transcriptional regulator
MGLRLTFLDWWTPKGVLCHELERVDAKTTAALREVIKSNAPDAALPFADWEPALDGNLESRRAAMAKRHVALAEALAAAVGRNQAILLGRKALFKVGKELGEETQRRLGVQTPHDLVHAAGILYRVLGIEFTVQWINPKKAVLTVHRCALADHYTEFTCQILSAADEGVMAGLLEGSNMKFQKMLTSGCNSCIAEITLEAQVQ